ncbi:MAG: type II secretion system GspH family protein [Puniceicoccales bacterium]|jgi:prepilin-type N-terminal cleavage/methylation domain-containing protein|nr:type II secretion system GspH family protein [Puniceicoccales bacterium]
MKTSTQRTQHKRNRGFTLIEILAVIAIIGILAGTIGTVVPMARERAARNTASSNLRNIVLGCLSYADTNNGRPIKEGSSIENGEANTPADFAAILARSGSEFNLGKLWYIPEDPVFDKSGKEVPQRVLQDGKTGNLLTGVKPIAWAVVVNANRQKYSNSKYPLIWTRGLGTGGEWVEDAPWGIKGGHIAFGDAHLDFFQNLTATSRKLEKFDGKGETSSYLEAIGDGAKVKEDS